jgi:hypothetical protein
VKPEGKPPNMQVETEILRVIDYAGSVGIRDFMVNSTSREAEQEVALFMAFQWTRVPTMSRDIRATYAKLIEELIRVASVSVERVRSLMEQHERETGEILEVTPESMVESVRAASSLRSWRPKPHFLRRCWSRL